MCSFRTPDGGHYQWEVMPFGVSGGPAHFQRVMDTFILPSKIRWKHGCI